jgi:hypothetical protein
MPKLSAAWPDKKLTMPILKVSWARALWVSKANTEAVRARRARVGFMNLFSSKDGIAYFRKSRVSELRYTRNPLGT